MPDGDGRRWHVFADTAEASPDDIAEPGSEQPFEGDRCTVEGRSIVDPRRVARQPDRRPEGGSPTPMNSRMHFTFSDTIAG